jgi:hypothetical protein
VYFALVDDQVVVLGVVHGRRDSSVRASRR